MICIAEEYMMENVLKQIKNTMKEKTKESTHKWKKFLQLAEKSSFDDVVDHWIEKFKGDKWKFDYTISYETNVRLIAKAIHNALEVKNSESIYGMSRELFRNKRYRKNMLD